MSDDFIELTEEEFDDRYPLKPNHLNASAGWAIGDAAESAFEQDERFDPGRALRTLVDDELVTAVGQ